jgi:predicted transcriptional regulator
VQREVLARLESAEGWMTISELVGEAGRSRYESIRRAISRLADSGLIEMGEALRRFGVTPDCHGRANKCCVQQGACNTYRRKTA